MAARNLDELLTAVRAGEYGDDISDLPAFGGEEPAETLGIYSWDRDRLLVSSVTGLSIVTREEHLERTLREVMPAARRAMDALLAVETDAGAAPDKRRVIGEERMSLHVAIQQRDPQAIVRQTAEGLRVLESWKGH